MAYVNIHMKQIELKIVYYGMGRAGKTTNLLFLHGKLDNKHKGQMVTLATEGESTIFFDFFPVELGEVHGMAVKLRMYTVPGQDYYEASRRLILDGADGVVFVIDSAQEKLAENLESFADLKRNLQHHKIDIERIPIIFQYNKRDLEPQLELGQIEHETGFKPEAVFEAIAHRGEGVRPTARAISRSVIQRFEI